MILTFEEARMEYDKEMLEKTTNVNIEKYGRFHKRICQRMSGEIIIQDQNMIEQWSQIHLI